MTSSTCLGRLGVGGPRRVTRPVAIPDRLQRAVVQQDDPFRRDRLPRLRRHQEPQIRRALRPPAVDGPRLGSAETGVDRPLAQPGRQLAQHPHKPGCLACCRQFRAVHNTVVDGGQSPPLQLVAPGRVEDAQRQAVLVSKPERQVEDIGAPAVVQAVPIEVSRPQAGGEHGLDLGAELDLNLVQSGAGQQLGLPIVAEEGTGLVE
jgi:hypothetical protein